MGWVVLQIIVQKGYNLNIFFIHSRIGETGKRFAGFSNAGLKPYQFTGLPIFLMTGVLGPNLIYNKTITLLWSKQNGTHYYTHNLFITSTNMFNKIALSQIKSSSCQSLLDIQWTNTPQFHATFTWSCMKTFTNSPQEQPGPHCNAVLHRNLYTLEVHRLHRNISSRKWAKFEILRVTSSKLFGRNTELEISTSNLRGSEV